MLRNLMLFSVLAMTLPAARAEVENLSLRADRMILHFTAVDGPYRTPFTVNFGTPFAYAIADAEIVVFVTTTGTLYGTYVGPLRAHSFDLVPRQIAELNLPEGSTGRLRLNFVGGQIVVTDVRADGVTTEVATYDRQDSIKSVAPKCSTNLWPEPLTPVARPTDLLGKRSGVGARLQSILLNALAR